MNKRQAGEDFYFLHKFTELGCVEELKRTRVIPSPRRSHRVPFGTGKAVGDHIDSGGEYLTYAPESFQDLRCFLSQVDTLFEGAIPDDLPESVSLFLDSVGFQEKLAEIRSNVTTLKAFKLRFFRWFNAFLVMKFVHFARDHFYPDVEVTEAARWLLEAVYGEKCGHLDAKSLLEGFRALDQAV